MIYRQTISLSFCLSLTEPVLLQLHVRTKSAEISDITSFAKSENLRLPKCKPLVRTNLKIAPSKLLINYFNIAVQRGKIAQKTIMFDCKIVYIIAVCFTTAGLTQVYYEPILGLHLEKVSNILVNTTKISR